MGKALIDKRKPRHNRIDILIGYPQGGVAIELYLAEIVGPQTLFRPPEAAELVGSRS